MNRLELLIEWYKKPTQNHLTHKLEGARSRQENIYNGYYFPYSYMNDEDIAKLREDDKELLSLFKSSFSWKERYRFRIEQEVLCHQTYTQDGEWSDDYQSIKDVVRYVKEPPEEFWEKSCEWDWDTDGEDIGRFYLGDEKKRNIDIDVIDLTPKFEIVEDSDSIKLVEIGGKSNV